MLFSGLDDLGFETYALAFTSTATTFVTHCMIVRELAKDLVE